MSPRRKPRPARREKSSVLLRDALFARPRPPFLFEEFAQSPPRLLVPGKKWKALDNRHKRYILWARMEGLSMSDVAWVLGFSRTTIHRFLQKVQYDTGAFLDCGFLMELKLGVNLGHVRYFCRACGMLYKDAAAATEHAYGHCWDIGLLSVPPPERAYQQRMLKRYRSQ